MKKKNGSEKGDSPRRSARISSATYKSAPLPLLPDPSTSTIRRCSQNKKPTSKTHIHCSGLSSNWTESQRVHRFFHKLSQSLSRKTMNFNWGPLNDELTSIFPSGDTFNWTDLSCGTTWIAVRGITSYVVVAMDPHLEHQSSLREYYHGMPPPPYFVVRIVLNQMGDLSSTLNKEVLLHIAQGNPFAVVSASPANFEDSQERMQASSRAIDFLKAKLLDCSDLTSKKILKIAVCALKQMFGPNFKSNQIVQAFYDRLDWSGGSNDLSIAKVEECLKELIVEDTSNEAEKHSQAQL